MICLPSGEFCFRQSSLRGRKAEGEPEPVVLAQQVVLDHEPEQAVGHEVEKVTAGSEHQGLANLERTCDNNIYSDGFLMLSVVMYDNNESCSMLSMNIWLVNELTTYTFVW
jgi:hypothetical protein